MAEVHVMGVRHHGPGSARAVLTRLDQVRPDVVLVEGPADADPLLHLVGRRDLVPPVALLGYAVDSPQLSGFWPLARFSPEWQALRWAADYCVPARCIDLPAAVMLALRRDQPPHAPADPITALSRAAGYTDPERWWEDLMESGATDDPFEVTAQIIAELRESAALGELNPDNLRREAHMRQQIREEIKAGRQRIAVVCGAWHAPALTSPLPPAAPDTRLLRGLPKVKARLTWVPWTHSRLAMSSGYGAGVASPGWYEHLFDAGEHPVEAWLTRVAHVLRAADLPVSTANVIEGTRLAETLSALRGRPSPGLREVHDATLAALCDGDSLMLDLVTRHLVVGEALGEVPDDLPSVPLEQDLAAAARRVRLRREPSPQLKELDLRKPTDLARSQLLHRLKVLEVPWGTPMEDLRKNLGSFRETWVLQWPPERAVQVVDASVWGTTVLSAAVAKVLSDALGASLSQLTTLVEISLQADLADAVGDLIDALGRASARDHDVLALMTSLPGLARASRYGDVRSTDRSGLRTLCDGMMLRICAGLPAAVGSLDDDSAGTMRTALEQVHTAVALLDSPEVRDRWLLVLRSVVDRADLHGLLAGRITRLLLDAGMFTPKQGGDRLARALSLGSQPRLKAAWIEGFLGGGGLMLIHDPELLRTVDEWVTALPPEDFMAVVPLLRRTFGQLVAGERQTIGERVRRLTESVAPQSEELDPDLDRAAAALATLDRLWGRDG